MWELKAACELARSWHERELQDAARDLLVPIHAWFGEGFDTRELRGSKALLESLLAPAAPAR